jgi:hypothetical protein
MIWLTDTNGTEYATFIDWNHREDEADFENTSVDIVVSDCAKLWRGSCTLSLFFIFTNNQYNGRR